MVKWCQWCHTVFAIPCFTISSQNKVNKTKNDTASLKWQITVVRLIICK